MPSLGPQLPPHLLKRKRDSIDGEDDSDDVSPPPAKQPANVNAAADNTDEIDLGDSEAESDHERLAPSTKIKAGPPRPSTSPGQCPTPGSQKPNPTIGPSLPPAPSEQTSTASRDPKARSDSDSEDDSEDDYGPSLPTASTSSRPAIGPSLPAAEAASQRDAWMLAPPTATGYAERDPTRLKSRKFTSKPSSAPRAEGDGGVASIWTETPEEKLRRLQDSVFGRTQQPQAGEAASGKQKKMKEVEERNRRTAASIEASRGKSLFDEHQDSMAKQGKPKEPEDDPSKRGFDREKDMAIGGKIDTGQRKQLVNNAANLGSKFSKGSFL